MVHLKYSIHKLHIYYIVHFFIFASRLAIHVVVMAGRAFYFVFKCFIKVKYLNSIMWFILLIHVRVNQDDYTCFQHSFTRSGTFKYRPCTEHSYSLMKILPAHFIPQYSAYHLSMPHRANELTWIILRLKKIVEMNLKCSIVKSFGYS